jgi:hypothetical protein
MKLDLIRKLGLRCAAFAVLSGCSTPTSPSVADASGTWVRDGCTNTAGQHIEGCPVVMTITQSGAMLSGAFTWEGISGGGSVSGTVIKTNVSASLTLALQPECSIKLSGTIAGDRWSGTGVFNCTGPVTIGNPGNAPYTFNRTR